MDTILLMSMLQLSVASVQARVALSVTKLATAYSAAMVDTLTLATVCSALSLAVCVIHLLFASTA